MICFIQNQGDRWAVVVAGGVVEGEAVAVSNINFQILFLHLFMFKYLAVIVNTIYAQDSKQDFVLALRKLRVFAIF